MTVIIEGMDVSKSCRECRLFRDDCCIISDKRTWGYSVHDEKPKDCPVRDMNEVLFSIFEDVSKLSWWQGKQKVCSIEAVWTVLNAKASSEKRHDEVKTGKWVWHEAQHDFLCSVCGYDSISTSKYCPYCGAKMERYER